MFGNNGKALRTTILQVEVPKGMFNWELVIRDHSDDLNQLLGRIHGFRWCINPRRTRGGQLGLEKQRDESVKALRNVRKSFVFPLVLPISARLPGVPGSPSSPGSPPHWKARRPWGGGCQHGENKTKLFVGICSSKKILLEIVCNVGFKVSKSKLYLSEVRLLCYSCLLAQSTLLLLGNVFCHFGHGRLHLLETKTKNTKKNQRQSVLQFFFQAKNTAT